MYKKSFIQCVGLSVFSLLTSISFASVPMPEACPNVSAIEGVGIDKAVIGGDSPDENWLVGKENAKYDTKDNWTYLMFVSSDTKERALVAAKKAMETLTFMNGPKDMRPYVEGWACLYSTSENHLAMAITPAISFPTDLRRLLKKF